MGDPVVSYDQSYQTELVSRVRAHERSHAESTLNAGTFVKVARILAVQVRVPFIVQTDRGPMRGAPGDWLVTNHPEDDAGSDIWCISDERMRSTYRIVHDYELDGDRVVFGNIAGEPVPYLDPAPTDGAWTPPPGAYGEPTQGDDRNG